MNKKLKILLYIVIFGLGFLIGNLISYYMREQLSSQEAPNIYLIIATLLFGIILQIIIHEAGHLFFGLLSGYKFISFKVFNFAIVSFTLILASPENISVWASTISPSKGIT